MAYETFQSIIDQIDELILLKLSDSTSLADWTDRTIGKFSISYNTSISTLMEMRAIYQELADSEDPYLSDPIFVAYR